MVQQKIRNKKIENTYINLDETENSSNSINSGGNKKTSEQTVFENAYLVYTDNQNDSKRHDFIVWRVLLG